MTLKDKNQHSKKVRAICITFREVINMKVKLRVVHEIAENPKSNEELRDDIVQFLCRVIREEREMAMEGGKGE